MPKLAINGSFAQFIEPLRKLESFETHGALKGVALPNGADAGGYELGRLPSDWRNTFTARSHLIDYVIYSYVTPVAWHDREAGWIVPNERYSITTSKQMGRIRPALDAIGGYTE